MNPVPDPLNWLVVILTIVMFGGWAWDQLVKLRVYLSRGVPGKQAPRTRRDYLVGSAIALLCAVLWSGSYVSLSYVARTQTSVTANIVILGSAAGFLFAGSAIARTRDRRKELQEEPIIQWRSGLGLGLVLANLGNFMLSILALHLVSASQAMALSNTYPLALVAILVVRERIPLSIGTALSVLLVLLGSWLANADVSFTLQGGKALAGGLVALAAGCAFALWVYLAEGVETTYKRPATRMRLLSAIFFASYAALVTWSWGSEPRPTVSRWEIMILVLNGLRVAVVYYLFQLAVRRAGALLPAVIAVFQVFLTLVWDRLVLGTALTIPLMVGAALIACGAIALLTGELQRVGPLAERAGGGAADAGRAVGSAADS